MHFDYLFSSFRCTQQQKDLDINQNDMINLIQVWYALRLTKTGAVYCLFKSDVSIMK